MNAVYWYEEGRELGTLAETDDLGIDYRSKTKKFFPWVEENATWKALSTFKPLVEALEQLRMSELHRFSRVRANFTYMALEPIDQCVKLLNKILTYFFDHLVAAVILHSTATYDASSDTPTIAIG